MKLLFAALVFLAFASFKGVTARSTLSLINHWYKVACIPSQIKDSDTYICDRYGRVICLPGWYDESQYCRVPLCKPKCVHFQGNCTAPDTCTCEVGWQGVDCSQCVCLPNCKHGKCNKPFECNCADGWEGMLCDKPICKEGCLHGTCTEPGQCNCHPGWSGENCTDCIPLPSCLHGDCTKPMECICEDGWTGNFCEIPICGANCSKTNGFCKQPGDCWCRPGYGGDGCHTCEVYPQCVNGFCKEPWDCICNEGWEGMLCDQRIPPALPGGVGADHPEFIHLPPPPPPPPKPVAPNTPDLFAQRFGNLQQGQFPFQGQQG